MTQKNDLSLHTLEWLLEEDNPSVRYLTLINILNKREDDKEVVEARNRIMEVGPVPEILSHQNPDGSFVARVRDGYLPKYKAAVWQAIFLAQLCADPSDERIRRLGQFIQDTNYSREHRLIGTYLELPRKSAFLTPPCYVANMIWALSGLGFYGDARVKDSIRWVLKYQRFDDGTYVTPTAWPYKGKRDKCFGRHSCYIGCTQALKAMTVIPPEDVTKEIKTFIEKAVEFVLLHRVYQRSHGSGMVSERRYAFLTFPLTYYDDVLEIMNTLLFFGIKERAMDDALKLILSKQNENGRWPLEKTVSRSLMHAKVEGKRKESKWITYKALSVWKRYEEI